MKAIDQIDEGKLDEEIKNLNTILPDSVIIITEGSTKEDKIKVFTETIEEMSLDEQQKIPGSVATFYNDIYSDEAISEDAVPPEPAPAPVNPVPVKIVEPKIEKPQKRLVPVKTKIRKGKNAKLKEVKPKEVKPKDADREKDQFGYMEGSVHNKIAKWVLTVIESKYELLPRSEVIPLPSRKGRKGSGVRKSKKDRDEFGFIIGSHSNLFSAAIKAAPLTMLEVKKLPWNEDHSTYYQTYKKLEDMGRATKDKEGRMSIKAVQ